MRVDILTLFPEMFPPVLDHSIVGRARKKGLLQVCCHQLRQFSPDPRGRVDDTVFGGGQGMLLDAPLRSTRKPMRAGSPRYRGKTSWAHAPTWVVPRKPRLRPKTLWGGGFFVPQNP